MGPQNIQIQVNANEDVRKGRYSNFFQITRGQEEATLDFLFVHPQSGGDVIARVIVSPAFLQKITELLNAQAKQPAIGQANQTITKEIGFRPPEAGSTSSK